MKTLLLFGFVTAAQSSAGIMFPEKYLDFRKASIDEIRGVIENTSDGDLESEIIDRVLLSHRWELIKYFFNYPPTSIHIPKKLDLITDEVYRDQIVLFLIKNDSRNFWPNEKLYGSVIWHYKMIEPFVPTFKRHLPNAKPLLDILETKALRLKAAAELEAAMTGQKPPTESTQPEIKIATPNPSTAAEPGPPIPTKKTATETAVPPPVGEAPHPRGWWIALAATLALAAAIFLNRRK